MYINFLFYYNFIHCVVDLWYNNLYINKFKMKLLHYLKLNNVHNNCKIIYTRIYIIIKYIIIITTYVVDIEKYYLISIQVWLQHSLLKSVSYSINIISKVSNGLICRYFRIFWCFQILYRGVNTTWCLWTSSLMCLFVVF